MIIMCSEIHSKQDLTYKFIIKTLNIRFHRYLGYEGEKLTFNNVELIPPANDNKYMDISYNVDEIINVNIEHQSSPVYESKMRDIYKYHIYLEAEDKKPVISCVVGTYNPNYGCKNAKIDYNMTISPDFFLLKDKNAKEILSNIKFKVKNNIPLTDNEAIDLILTPDMSHNFDIVKLFEITSDLLKRAIILDNGFRLDLFACHKKMLRRFFNQDDYVRFVKMVNIKAEDYGFEPNVTGFEEAVELSYIEGKEDGFDEKNLDVASKMFDLGFDEEDVFKVTGLTREDINCIK